MRSFIAQLRTLVLPYGAISGPRIVLNGVDGVIQVYDATGLIALIDSTGVKVIKPSTNSFVKMLLGATSAALQLQPPDVAAHTLAAGSMQGSVGGVGENIPQILISSPTIDGGGDTELFIAGVSDTGSPSFAELIFASAAGYLEVGGDIRINTGSIGRGALPAWRFISTANDAAARAAGVNTDMVLAPTVDNTRVYEVGLKCQFNVGTAAAIYAVNLSDGGTVGVNNGTVIDRFDRWSAADTPAGSLTVHASSTLLYLPGTSGAKTLRVRNDAGSGGTLLGVGAAGIQRDFWIKDIGKQ